MSQRAMRLSVRDQLQNVFNLDADSVEVGFSGQPKPNCGQLYIAVHGGSWAEHPSGDNDLDEVFSVLVTVSMRLGAVPMDRFGIDVLDLANTGLEVNCRMVIGAIHKQYNVMNAANSVYIASPFSGFIEPLLFMDGGHSEPKGPDWFHAEREDGNYQPSDCGVAQTIVFGKARRVQQIFPTITVAPPNLPLTAPISAPYALPAGRVGQAYSGGIPLQLVASGGVPGDTYTFAVVTGALPTGISLSANGFLSGNPATIGANAFRISITDSIGLIGYQNYTLAVTA